MRSNRLKILKKAINQKHGKTVGTAINMKPHNIPRLTTGSLSFDFALGGGLPVGHLSMLRGSESSGKTTTAMRIGALAQSLCSNCLRPVKDLKVVEVGVDEETGEVEHEAQATCDCYKKELFKPEPYPEEYSNRDKGTLKQCEVEVTDEKTGKTKKKKSTLFKERIRRYEENSYEEFRVAWFDVEGAFNSAWARSVGMDERRLLMIAPATAEETIDIYDDLMRTGEVDLLILDSIAAMTPSIEVEASTEDEQRAAQAKLINKFVRKMTSGMRECHRDYGMIPTQIWINQERVTMGQTWGDNTIMPAGFGQKFGSSVIVKMWASKWEKAQIDPDLKKEFQLEIGKEVQMNFKILKNRTAPAHGQGSYVLRVVGANRGRVEDFPYVLAQATKYGMFREEVDGKKKKWFVGDEEFERKGSALARMEDPNVLVALKRAILKKMIEGRDAEE